MTPEILWSMLVAGAGVVGQESVKLATKSAYEWLRSRMSRMLGEEAVASAGEHELPPRQIKDGLQRGLAGMSMAERAELEEALRRLTSDPEWLAALPNSLVTRLKSMELMGSVLIEAGDGINRVITEVDGLKGNDFTIRAGKRLP